MPQSISFSASDIDTQAVPRVTFAMVNGQRVPVTDDTPEPITFSMADLTPTTQEEPQTIGRLVRHAAEGLNPMPIFNAIRHPIDTAHHIVDAHVQTAIQAADDYRNGDYMSAAIRATIGSIPLFGPGITHAAADLTAGKWADAIGDALAIGISAKVPELAGTLLARARIKLPENPNPVERAAVATGMARGIPVDAGTATGNAAVQLIQGAADSSPVGAFIAGRAKARQAAAMTREMGREAASVHPSAVTPEQAGYELSSALTRLTRAQDADLARTGRGIAGQVHPTAVTPEQAGAALTTSGDALVDTLNQQAEQHYGTLRTMEADPSHARMVPDVKSPRETAALSKRMGESLGSHPPSVAELQEMRRILAEMDSMPFVKRTFNEGGAGQGGDLHVTGGAAGAPVYDDILQHQPGSSMMTRGEIINSIRTALQDGTFTNGAKGALEVARRRLAGDTTVSRPSLPPEAGDLRPGRKAVLLPVAVKDAKPLIKPFYEQMLRRSQLTPQSIMGADAKALNAMDQLMRGPDYESLSVVDQALSDIKALARRDGGPAKLIVSALEPQVQAAVRRAGPAAVDALEKGRTAIKTRVLVEETLEALKKEPVASYRMATSPADSAITRLRELQNVAPDVMPQVGRAWLDDALHQATTSGGFDAATFDTAWQRLGPGTKAAIFPGGQAAAIDQLVAQAKTVAESRSSLPKEPVGAYRMVTAPKDSAIVRLRELQQVAPDVMPQVGRAWLDDALKVATDQGGFQHAAKLDAEWRRMGPETKAILFPGGQAAALDQLFLLGKKLALDPNPSGTAKMAVAFGELQWAFTHPVTGVPIVIGSGMLSAILHSPTAVRALTNGVALFNRAPSIGARLAGYQAIAQAVRVAREGVPSLVPAAAAMSEPPDPRSGP